MKVIRNFHGALYGFHIVIGCGTLLLPQFETLGFWNEHLVCIFHVECVIPHIYVWQGTVHAPASEGVRVALCAVAYLFLCDVCCPYS